MLFELAVIILAAVFLLILRTLDPHILKKFGFTFLGVLIFEYFTQALWVNANLERWAYLYLDVSWVMTLGWATIIIVCRTLIDLYFRGKTEGQRFLSYIVPITIIGFIAEGIVIALGFRQYPPAVQAILSGNTLFHAPVEALYYIPVFMTLVIAFSRYWEASTSRGAPLPAPIVAVAARRASRTPKARAAARKKK